MTPKHAASLFPGAGIEKRVEVLVKAGRVSVENAPFVLEQMRQAVAEEREACAMTAHYELGSTEAEAIEFGIITRERATAIKIRGAIRARGTP